MSSSAPTANDVLPDFFLSDDPEAVAAAARALPHLSSGRVTGPAVLDVPAMKPRRDGLLCARIFGPVEDHRCLCGALSSEANAGKVCEQCGVLCGKNGLRHERWGHIDTPVPLLHPVLLPRLARALALDGADVRLIALHRASLGADGSLVRAARSGEGGGAALRRALAGREAASLLIDAVPVTPPGWRRGRRNPQETAYEHLLVQCNNLARPGEGPRPSPKPTEGDLQAAFEHTLTTLRAELLARRDRPGATPGSSPMPKKSK